MKRLLPIILFTLSISAYSQIDTCQQSTINQVKKIVDLTPTLVLMIGSSQFILDSISIKRIDPEWIKKIVVIKDKKEVNIYGNKGGVVCIYPKRKFCKRIKTDLKLNGT